MIDQIVFYTLAATIVVMSLLVILARNPVRSAIYLISALLAMAGLYVRLQAEFIAGVQILVYVGGIMVLFLFVIMLVSLKSMEQQALVTRQWKLAAGVSLLVVAELIYLVVRGREIFAVKAAPLVLLTKTQNTQVVGELLYSTYLLPFEISSVLLLVAIIGAVLLAKNKI